MPVTLAATNTPPAGRAQRSGTIHTVHNGLDCPLGKSGRCCDLCRCGNSSRIVQTTPPDCRQFYRKRRSMTTPAGCRETPHRARNLFDGIDWPPQDRVQELSQKGNVAANHFSGRRYSSAYGYKQTSSRPNLKSASPPRADVAAVGRESP